MTRRTRRTLAGTLAPGDAYAPSLFPDEHPAPAAPLALFDLDAGRLPVEARTYAPPCAVCAAFDHQTDACPRGAAVDLFAPEPIDPPDALDALRALRLADLHTIEETGPTPFLRRKAAEALAALADGDEDHAARIIATMEAQR